MENIVTVFPNDCEVARLVGSVAHLRVSRLTPERVLGEGLTTVSHVKHPNTAWPGDSVEHESYPFSHAHKRINIHTPSIHATQPVTQPAGGSKSTLLPLRSNGDDGYRIR